MKLRVKGDVRTNEPASGAPTSSKPAAHLTAVLAPTTTAQMAAHKPPKPLILTTIGPAGAAARDRNRLRSTNR